MTRFLRLLGRDAEGRIARLTVPERLDDDRVSAVLGHSAALAIVEGGVRRFRRAVEMSQVNAIAQRVVTRWQDLAWTRQRLMSGVILLVAVGVHLGLRIWREPDPGWLWLVLPATAATIGTLLIVGSLRPETGRR